MSEEFTALDAMNPATPPRTLAAIASARPDLRQLVAANPATPAPVLEWLASLGGIGSEVARVRTPPPPHGQWPVSPAAPTGPVPFGGPAAPRYVPPGGHGAPAGYGAGPYATPQQHTRANYGAGPYASPAQHGYVGSGGFGADPYAAVPAPQDAYGYQLPERSSRTGIVVAVVVGAVLVLGALAFVAVTVIGLVDPSSTYGDDPGLDLLWDGCADGDGQACDDLYLQSPLSSGYEQFGDTCGERFPPGQVWCADRM